MGEPTNTWINETQPTKLNQEHNFCDLKRVEGGVYILNLTGEIQHRFTPKAIRSIDESLDQVLRDASACALITTNQILDIGWWLMMMAKLFKLCLDILWINLNMESGKFFSNGMDVDYIKDCNKQVATEYLQMFQRLVSKLLTFCLPTIAVIRGHAVGAGFIFALAHDYRLMTSSRGYIFMNEIDLGMSLTPGNMAVLRSKLPLSTFQEATLTGKHYDGERAAAAGIVHATCPIGPKLLEEGINIAMEYKARNWKRQVYYALKMEMFKTTVTELENGEIGFARM
ncbi:enoyl-CoA delta isomerase 2, peroxisomal-like [Cornus florida]|uniref:enoyl-CoA delta isomerase 2, peroxisomal-like n=1 Tax=Cornus florida TaxID=4283 RepID=UPI002898C40F|nr:enoyl-CoA delta isomerase 2, peroxisomal-like [Cornus florida]